MTNAERELLVALAGMCAQYLEDKGELDHQCMSAGQHALELLVKYGLVTPIGRGGIWTETGKAALLSR